MKNLIIACSPRHGNTDALAQFACKRLVDCEIVYIRDSNFSPCKACGICEQNNVCVSDDDAQILQRKILHAKNVWFFAPVFFAGFDSQTKAFIDRAQIFWHSRQSSGVKFHLIACGGQRNVKTFDGMKNTLEAFAFILGGVLDKILFFPQVDEIGTVGQKNFDELEKLIEG